MALIQKIKHLLERDWDVEISYIYRDANHAANWLVFRGHSLVVGLHFYCTPPSALGGIISKDSRRVALPYLVV